MTGNQLDGTPNEVNQISEKALNRLREIVKPPRENKPKNESPCQLTTAPKLNLHWLTFLLIVVMMIGGK